jgi:hypothetical protein
LAETPRYTKPDKQEGRGNIWHIESQLNLKALDDVVFDILGLTQDERNEVYWSVCELVKNRLEKARSV